MKQSKKFIAIMLTFVFVLSLLPLGALAAEETVTIPMSSSGYVRGGTSYADKTATELKTGVTISMRNSGSYGINTRYALAQYDVSDYMKYYMDPNMKISLDIHAGYNTNKCYSYEVFALLGEYDLSTVTMNNLYSEHEVLLKSRLGVNTSKAISLATFTTSAAVTDQLNSHVIDKDVLKPILEQSNGILTILINGSTSTSYIYPEGAGSGLKVTYDSSSASDESVFNELVKGVQWSDLSDDETTSVSEKLKTEYNGAEIEWSSEPAGIVEADGTINTTRAAQEAVLTASFSYTGDDGVTYTDSKQFEVTIAPEKAKTVCIPFTNYAYSRPGSPDNPYGYATKGGYHCVQVDATFNSYAQLNLAGYEQILNNPSTTAAISLEAGYEFSDAEINPIKGYIAPDSADGYESGTITYNIAEKLGIHSTNNPVLFETTQTDVTPGSCATASANLTNLISAINNSSDSFVTLYLARVSGNSKIRINSKNSGLFISYYESEIDDAAYCEKLEGEFAWTEITEDSQDALVNDLPTYFRGATISWESTNGKVNANGTLADVDGIEDDIITATVTYKGMEVTSEEFPVTVCDGKITLGEPELTFDGNTATASISVTNGTDKPVSYQLYLAIYDGNEMTAVVPFTLEAGKASENSASETLNAAGNKAKFFVWKADGITPVRASVVK